MRGEPLNCESFSKNILISEGLQRPQGGLKVGDK